MRRAESAAADGSRHRAGSLTQQDLEYCVSSMRPTGPDPIVPQCTVRHAPEALWRIDLYSKAFTTRRTGCARAVREFRAAAGKLYYGCGGNFREIFKKVKELEKVRFLAAASRRRLPRVSVKAMAYSERCPLY